MEQYYQKPMEILPFAFYALCDLDSEKMKAYRQLCATDLDDNTIKLPPQAQFQNQPLRPIVKYHVELGAGVQFDTTYFMGFLYMPILTSLYWSP